METRDHLAINVVLGGIGLLLAYLFPLVATVFLSAIIWYVILAVAIYFGVYIFVFLD